MPASPKMSTSPPSPAAASLGGLGELGELALAFEKHRPCHIASMHAPSARHQKRTRTDEAR